MAIFPLVMPLFQLSAVDNGGLPCSLSGERFKRHHNADHYLATEA